MSRLPFSKENRAPCARSRPLILPKETEQLFVDLIPPPLDLIPPPPFSPFQLPCKCNHQHTQRTGRTLVVTLFCRGKKSFREGNPHRRYRGKENERESVRIVVVVVAQQSQTRSSSKITNV